MGRGLSNGVAGPTLDEITLLPDLIHKFGYCPRFLILVCQTGHSCTGLRLARSIC